ncbi:MAG: dihydrofolate reductase family protein [Streptosporangiales bacterium]|nr:dihydrofolate reductase family protein [Streptosporangiales bacterium]MBO0889854.1 dihydrofolate reductase family protein [Acidothermales bacterium]
MAKLLYAAAMSLDGFIAGHGGDMHWLTDHLGPNPLADELVDGVGALLVGANTFRGDDPNKGTDSEGAFGGRWHGPQFVLTHRPPDEPVPDTTFLDDLDAAVTAAKAAAGGKYVNVLGANVAKQCLEAGVLDEILVFVVPVLLGDGVRVFWHPGGTDVRLDRIRLVDTANALWFRVAR